MSLRCYDSVPPNNVSRPRHDVSAANLSNRAPIHSLHQMCAPEFREHLVSCSLVVLSISHVIPDETLVCFMDELRVSSQVWELGEKTGLLHQSSSGLRLLLFCFSLVLLLYSRENRSALYWGENSEGLQTEV